MKAHFIHSRIIPVAIFFTVNEPQNFNRTFPPMMFNWFCRQIFERPLYQLLKNFFMIRRKQFGVHKGPMKLKRQTNKLALKSTC